MIPSQSQEGLQTTILELLEMSLSFHHSEEDEYHI